HGSIDALGFRVHDLAYLPDVSDMKPEAWRALDNLDCWVLDALRYTPHPTHAHVEKSLGWLAQSGTRRGVLTNMHIDIDHDTIEAETPDNISAAYDGMTITYEI
ncbi:MAG: MBL fold metallo-hydrolase, partial [Maritimibacter harenae]